MIVPSLKGYVNIEGDYRVILSGKSFQPLATKIERAPGDRARGLLPLKEHENERY